MKKFLLVFAIAWFSLNLSGCDELKNFSLMPEEENTVDELAEKNDSDSEKETEKNVGNNELETETTKLQNANESSVKFENQKNETPFVNLNKNIAVRKDEMDKLIRIARDCRWTEDDVRKAVIILKNCGIDVAAVREIGTFNEGISSGYTLAVNPNENELIDETFYLQLSNSGTKEIEKVYVNFKNSSRNNGDLSQNYYLYVREGNVEKILGNCDKLFLPISVYEKIHNNVVSFVNSKGGKCSFKHYYKGNYRTAFINLKRNYDSARNTIFYEMDSESVKAEVPSEVYGVNFEAAELYGIFDADGNAIDMNLKRKQ